MSKLLTSATLSQTAAKPNPFIMTIHSNIGNGSPTSFTIAGAEGEYIAEVWQNGTLISTSGTLLNEQTLSLPAQGLYDIHILPVGSNPFHRIRFFLRIDRSKVIGIKSFGDVQWSTFDNAFNGCNISFIDDIIRKGKNVTNFQSCFRDNNLTDIPAGLFDNCPNVTNFQSCFRDNNLTDIPAGLFDNCPNVISFDNCFTNNNLTSIPAGLFDNCPNVTAFGSSFWDNNITSIPAGLFDNCPNVTIFGGCFRDNNITSIPAGLFDNNPNVTDFSSCFWDNNLTDIPAGLFDNCPNVTTFFLCFANNNITSIPAGLFNNNPNVFFFNGCFTLNTLDVNALSRLYIELEATNQNINVSFGGGLGQYDPNFTIIEFPKTTGVARADLVARGWTLTDGGSV